MSFLAFGEIFNYFVNLTLLSYKTERSKTALQGVQLYSLNAERFAIAEGQNRND